MTKNIKSIIGIAFLFAFAFCMLATYSYAATYYFDCRYNHTDCTTVYVGSGYFDPGMSFVKGDPIWPDNNAAHMAYCEGLEYMQVRTRIVCDNNFEDYSDTGLVYDNDYTSVYVDGALWSAAKLANNFVLGQVPGGTSDYAMWLGSK